MIWLILIALICLVLWFLLKRFKKIKVNHEVMITGECGSGKTLNAVKMAIKRHKINLKRVKKFNKNLPLKNFIRKLFKKDLLKIKHYPCIYSNFPINSEYNILITRDMLLLKEKLIEDSVIVLDEFGTMASQYEFNDEELRVNLGEFTGKFRHYVGENALLIIIDQSSERVLKEVKYSLGEFYEFQNFHKFLFFFWCKCITYLNFKQIDFAIDKENVRLKFGLLPLKKLYESRYLKNRVDYLDKFKVDYRGSEKLTIDVLTRLGQERSNLDRIVEKKIKINK